MKNLHPFFAIALLLAACASPAPVVEPSATPTAAPTRTATQSPSPTVEITQTPEGYIPLPVNGFAERVDPWVLVDGPGGKRGENEDLLAHFAIVETFDGVKKIVLDPFRVNPASFASAELYSFDSPRLGHLGNHRDGNYEEALKYVLNLYNTDPLIDALVVSDWDRQMFTTAFYNGVVGDSLKIAIESGINGIIMVWDWKKAGSYVFLLSSSEIPDDFYERYATASYYVFPVGRGNGMYDGIFGAVNKWFAAGRRNNPFAFERGQWVLKFQTMAEYFFDPNDFDASAGIP